MRFYRWQPSAVSVGKNQNPEAEVYLDACKRLGVDVVRRMSGGGTVYHDYEGEVTYSLIAKTADLGTADITSVYAKIYEAIQAALGAFRHYSRLQQRRRKKLPQHDGWRQKNLGQQPSHHPRRRTPARHSLRSVDLPKMFTLLKLKNASCSQAADIAKRKITSVENELGRAVTPEAVADALT